ncbi:hypothetical protein Gotri_013399, partial [Gossypium trilobum]|nr:hypothetical protein [Gossypium trilobum]
MITCSIYVFLLSIYCSAFG